MYPSIPTHIHLYMSKLRLLLKLMTIPMGYVYIESRICAGPRPRVFHYWCTGPAARPIGSGSYIMPIQEC